ncbi:MAG: hypothetical protein JSV09_14410 [Thermoplasmata archaeon]|nr:MAG: hypothetical protein JSV09_14410 [Thermoplasmata archaeon]
MKIRKGNLTFEKFGKYLCLFSLILIAICFTFLPISSYEGFEAGFHPLLPLLIIGLSLSSLSLTFIQKKVEVRIGTLAYSLPIIITGPIYISGFERYWGIPEESHFFHWEIGMHLIIIGLILQYLGSLLISPKESDKNMEKPIMEDETDKVKIGFNKIIVGLMKKIAHILIIISFILVIIFVILAPLKAFNVI